MNKNNFKIYFSGNKSLTIELGNSIDENINNKVLALFHHLKKLNISNIIDIIPAYCTVTVILKNFPGAATENKNTVNHVRQIIESAVDECDFGISFPSRLIEIPVCYDNSLGIDIEEMSVQNKISIEEIISIHSNKVYRVFMIGFLPGFAYMGWVDDRIVSPRKNIPRTVVPAGSVGIAGKQTGIYPFDSPGGWNIIGRTPLRMFDAKKKIPVLLSAGDEVKFIPDTYKEFQSPQP